MALKADKPVDTYQEMIEESQKLRDAPKIEELTQSQQDWYRKK